jgi:hypothetical protein
MLKVRSSQWLVACLVNSLGTSEQMRAVMQREPIALALLEAWLRTINHVLCQGEDGDETPRRALGLGEVDVAVGELVERVTGVAGACPEGAEWARGFGPQGRAVALIIKRLMLGGYVAYLADWQNKARPLRVVAAHNEQTRSIRSGLLQLL